MPETLKREANPPSGQLAAPLPQAWDAALKDFRKLTGELVQDSADPDARRFAMDVIPWSKTTGGVWVPGQVNAQLTGRLEPQVTTLLRNTPLGASQSYTQSPAIDTQEYTFPNGSNGVLSVSGLAIADKQGTLYLEASNDGTTWVRVTSVAVNNTGVGRLRRTNVFTRYIRFRFTNGLDPQTSFQLWQTLWQTTDGQGDEYGQGADRFQRSGALAPGVSEVVADIRSAIEVYSLLLATDEQAFIRLRVEAYKDDGSLVTLTSAFTANGSGPMNGGWLLARDVDYYPLWETAPGHNPSGSVYRVRLALRPVTLPKGIKVTVNNSSASNSYNAGVELLCRLL